MTARSQFPLLLVTVQGQPGKPDRKKALNAIKLNAGSDKSWYTLSTSMSHEEWLDAIPAHRFVLAPFGHGLDTHRLSEILLMGGIPVIRKYVGLSIVNIYYDCSLTSYHTLSMSFSMGLTGPPSVAAMMIVIIKIHSYHQQLSKPAIHIIIDQIILSPEEVYLSSF